jgi:hypothetical protein
VNHTVHHDAIPDTYQIVTEGDFTGYCKEMQNLGNGEEGFTIGDKFYKIYNGNGAPHEQGFTLKYLMTTGTPAWDEVVIDHSAWTETVIDTPAWTETVKHSEWVCSNSFSGRYNIFTMLMNFIAQTINYHL